MEFLNQGIETALKNKGLAAPILQNTFPLKKTPLLKEIDLKGKTLTDEEYDKKLDDLQDELSQLHYKLLLHFRRLSKELGLMTFLLTKHLARLSSYIE